MVKLFDVNERNWLDVSKLNVSDEQKYFLDSAIGILARGYAYRFSNAKVIGIANDSRIIGLALAKDLDESPSCYDLQQFMIDKRFQNKGYGTEALRLILSLFRKEHKYESVEVCVKSSNAPALRVFEKVGFTDTGYLDESLPDTSNLIYRFDDDSTCFSDMLISNFSVSLFQEAFKQHFKELNITVKNWDGLFKGMNDEGDNAAFVRTTRDGQIVGFLQFKPIKFTSWFFEEVCGFIREFWVAKEFRNSGHGLALINLTEKHFIKQGIYTSILTTDSADESYMKRGYIKAHGCKAKNNDLD